MNDWIDGRHGINHLITLGDFSVMIITVINVIFHLTFSGRMCCTLTIVNVIAGVCC